MVKKKHAASRVYKRKNFLSLLCEHRNNTIKRNKLIDLASNDEVKAVCEVISNILNGNIKLASSNIKKLQKYKRILRLLADRKTSAKDRKKTLKQTGGFLSVILPAALSLLTSIFSRR